MVCLHSQIPSCEGSGRCSVCVSVRVCAAAAAPPQTKHNQSYFFLELTLLHSQFIPSCKQNPQPSRKEKGQVNSRTTRPRAHLNALSREGGARLDLPNAVTDGVQVETLCDLGGGGGCQQVLLVGEDQHRNPTQLLLIQQLSQLLKGTNTRSAKKKSRTPSSCLTSLI